MYLQAMTIVALLINHTNGQCQCFHIIQQQQCQYSASCIWKDQRCLQKECSFIESELECQKQFLCFFLNGKCISQKDCSNLKEIECKLTPCIWTGENCIFVQNCYQLQQQQLCEQRFDVYGSACIWSGSSCRKIQACSEAPTNLIEDFQCRQQLTHCTVRLGGGCQLSATQCEGHQRKEQCRWDYSLSYKCYWNDVTQTCVKDECQFHSYSSDQQCRIHGDCYSDGLSCIKWKACDQVKNSKSCTSDSNGLSCVFFREQCYQRLCSGAPSGLVLSLFECQDFGSLCIPRADGGCQTMVENYCSINETKDACIFYNCIWDRTSCRKYLCSDSLDHVIECRVNECLVNMQGRCIPTPQVCGDVIEQFSCIVDRNKNACKWTNLGCVELRCENLKYPEFKSHTDCFNALSTCTFNSSKQSCEIYQCEQLTQNECQQSTNCLEVQKCQLKSIYNSPRNFSSHHDCFAWNPRLTVAPSGVGCALQYEACTLYIEQQQCFQDLNGLSCKWMNNSCHFAACVDFDSSAEIACSKLKVREGSCFEKPGQTLCQSVKFWCTQFLAQLQCEQFIECKWGEFNCQKKSCQTAPPQISAGGMCSDWMKGCVFHNLLGCVVESNSTVCNKIENVLTHEQCQFANSKCTVLNDPTVKECLPLPSQCADHLVEAACIANFEGTPCIWTTSGCKERRQDVCNQQSALRENECQLFSKECHLNYKIESSICNYLKNCENYTQKQNCVINSMKQLCIWKNNSCVIMQCSDNVDAVTQSECLRISPDCQLKYQYDGSFSVGCETAKSCSDITTEEICIKYVTTTHQLCFWDSFYCKLITDCYDLKDYWKTDLKHKDCQAFNQSCTYNQTLQRCVAMFPNCGSYTQEGYCSRLDNCYWYNSWCIYVDRCETILNLTACPSKFDPNTQKCEVFGGTTCVTQLPDNCLLGESDCLLCSLNFFYESATCKLAKHCEEFQNEIACVRTTSCFWDDFTNSCGDYCICPSRTDNTRQTLLDCIAVNACCTLYLPNGYGCIQRACSQTSSSECLPFLESNYGIICAPLPGHSGCQMTSAAPECNLRSQVQCEFDKNCRWDSTCVEISCSDRLPQPKGHYDCFNYSPKCTIEILEISIPNCKLREDCTQYQESIYCLSDDRCKWAANCEAKKCEDFVLGHQTTRGDCHSYLKGCLNYGNSCVASQSSCSLYYEPQTCSKGIADGNTCYWEPLGNRCSEAISSIIERSESICEYYNLNFVFESGDCLQRLRACQEYIECELMGMKSLQKIPCQYNGISCEDRTCEGFKFDPQNLQREINQANCQAWLPECIPNSDFTNCIKPLTCQQYTNLDQCSQFNQKCMIGTIPGKCQELAERCSDYRFSEQCKLTIKKKPCYWIVEQAQCADLTDCNLIASTTWSHQICESIYSVCTLRSSMLGCMQKKPCDQYEIAEHCYSDNFGRNCIWLNQRCFLHECQSALLQHYSNINCQTFLSDCSVSKFGDSCSLKERKCELYNQTQCQSDVQTLSGEKCIYTSLGCLSISCTNLQLSECGLLPKKCISVYCLQRTCQFYRFDTDIQCQQVSMNFQCRTTGSYCVDRTSCEDVEGPEGCTFSSENKICTWEDGKCKTKTCETAPPLMSSEQECQSYFDQTCTIAPGGRCKRKSSCSDQQIIEACTTDIQGKGCVWSGSECVEQRCDSICGDGIVGGLDEECDDANDIPFDGCYKCKFSCPTGCLTCVGRICQSCLDRGFYLKNDSCVTICGDGVVAGNELCDDGNLIELDGCSSTCLSECQDYCELCINGLCERCTPGWTEIGGICQNQCGDGVLGSTEECDDQNKLSFDGCSHQCLVENDWQCLQKEGQSSTCIVQERFDIFIAQLRIETQGEQLMYQFNITFNQRVRFESPITLQVVYSSRDIILIEQSIQSNTNSVLLQIFLPSVHSTSRVAFSPNKQVKLASTCKSVSETMSSISLKRSIGVQYDQSFRLSAVKQFNNALLYSLLILACILLFAWNLDVVWNMLDILQQLSYLRYINIEFPYVLQSFLEVYDILQIHPIVEALGLDIWTTIQSYFEIPTSELFQGKLIGINAIFLANIESFIILTLLIYLGKQTLTLITKIIHSELWELKSSTFLIHATSRGSPRKNTNFLTLIRKTFRGIDLIASSFWFSRLCFSSIYEISFICFLQLLGGVGGTFLEHFSYWVGIGFYLLVIRYICQFLYLSNFQPREASISELFEGYSQDNKNFWKYIISFQFIRIAFILLLVFLQENPIIQTTLISQLWCFQFILVLCFRPYLRRLENYKYLAHSSIISITTMSFLFYLLPEEFISAEFCAALAWVQIALFTFTLTFQFIIDSTHSIAAVKKLKRRENN